MPSRPPPSDMTVLCKGEGTILRITPVLAFLLDPADFLVCASRVQYTWPAPSPQTIHGWDHYHTKVPTLQGRGLNRYKKHLACWGAAMLNPLSTHHPTDPSKNTPDPTIPKLPRIFPHLKYSTHQHFSSHDSFNLLRI